MRAVESTQARAASVRSWSRMVLLGPAAATSTNPSSRAFTIIPASPKTDLAIGTRLTPGFVAGDACDAAGAAAAPDCASAEPAPPQPTTAAATTKVRKTREIMSLVHFDNMCFAHPGRDRPAPA